MEEAIKYFDFDFELSLRERFQTIWDFPCVDPLKLCVWYEENNGSIGIIDHEED